MITKSLIIISLVTIFLLFGCSDDKTTNVPTPTEEGTAFSQQTVPVTAAQDTVILYNKSAVDRDGSLYPEIPIEFWAEGIKKLNPQKVYYHNNNLVVLFEDWEEFVDGVYVYVPISSYWPGDEEIIELTLEEGSTYILRIQQ